VDARTRERLPVLAATADRNRKNATARLGAARDAPPGGLFTAGGRQVVLITWADL
jgi:hypothetical protein